MSGYVPRKLRDRSGVSRGGRTRSVKVEDDTPSTRKSRGSSSPRRPSPSGRRPSPKGGRAPAKRRARTVAQWRRLTVLPAILALVAVVLLTVTLIGSGQVDWRMAGVFGRSDAEVGEAQKDAEATVTALLSYDYRNFSDSITNGRAHTTGYYETQYVKFLEDLGKTVKKEKASVEAKVVGMSVVETDATCQAKKGPEYDGVEFLAFVNQITRNKNISGSRIDKSRVVLCMVDTDTGWKAADLKAL